MKKIIIITAILLFAISAFAQKTSRERMRHEEQKPKSETAVRRSAVQKKGSTSKQANRTRQANTRDISRAHNTRKRTSLSNSLDRTGAGSSSLYKSGKGQDKSRNNGNVGRNNGRFNEHKPTQNRGNIRPYNGYKSPQRDGNNGRYAKNTPTQNKGNVNRNNGYNSSSNKGKATRYNGSRNDQSIRGNNGRQNNASGNYAKQRSQYTTPNRRAVRKSHVKVNQYNPVRYRKVNYHYRAPQRLHVTWTNRMYHDYRIMYPEYRYWYYPIGYRIVTIPTYNAYFHIGEVRNVYGRVHEIYYSWNTDEYHLYFGGAYPYHDFTVVISGNHARRFSRQHPEMYFEGRYMWVTGLVSTFEGRPEIFVKRRSQIHLY